MRSKKSINVRVGLNIHAAREAAGYTQEALSELLGITPNHLSAIERGLSGASLEMIEKLCSLFGISADYLIFGERQTEAFETRLAAQLVMVKEEYRPQVQKVLSALLEILLKQGSKEPNSG